jgi:hypothetical protein
MTEDEHILTTVAEEGVEVAQRVTKALRFGLQEVQPDPVFNPRALDNADRIREEMEDLLGAYFVAERRGLVPPIDFSLDNLVKLEQSKRARIFRFMDIGEKSGVLHRPPAHPYRVGPVTMERVFRANGMTDLSNTQDAIEGALTDG